MSSTQTKVFSSVQTIVYSGKKGNYRRWKTRFKAVLNKRGVGYILDGGEDKRPRARDTTEAVEEWRASNRLVYDELVLALDDVSLDVIALAGNRDGLAAWAKLSEHHEGKASNRKVGLLLQLLSSKFAAKEELESEIAEMESMRGQSNRKVGLLLQLLSSKFAAKEELESEIAEMESMRGQLK